MIYLKKKLFLSLFLVSISLKSFSDENQGIFYRHLLLEDVTSVHILEIDPSCFDLIAVKAAHDLESVESMALRNQAIAAINGGFFYRNNHKSAPVGILKINNEWYGFPRHPRGAIGWSNESGQILFDQLLTTTSRGFYLEPQSTPRYTNTKDWKSMTYIVGGTPILVRSSQIITDFSTERVQKTFLNNKHARTAIGLLPNGHILFVVVDGTHYYLFSNLGITIPDLSALMKSLGCSEALNLDGGGSSTMFYQNRVVNKPCGEIYDGKGHYIRKVSDAILLLPKHR